MTNISLIKIIYIYISILSAFSTINGTGGRLNIKMLSYQNTDPRVKDKTV